MSDQITNRERMYATLEGEILDYIPSWGMGFYNVETAQRLIPPEVQIDDLGIWPRNINSSYHQQYTKDELEKVIAFNHYIDRVGIGVGRGANLQFGHGGPGEFAAKVIERSSQFSILKYETGAKAKVQHKPHFFHYMDMPVKNIDDLESLVLPDLENPERWRGYSNDIRYLKSRGEFTVGWINGFFSGCHYFFCEYQDFLVSLISDLELAERLVNKLGKWNLRAAQIMLEAGVDCIGFCDDLGSSNALLINPDLYNRLFLPWHRRLCEMAHFYNAKVHMHSHGNINKIIDRLVLAGIDMLNPLDPTEGMDLPELKERYGKQITLVGGMHKNIFEEEIDEIERSLRQAINIGVKGGRFILMDTGGIPDTMSLEKYLLFKQTSKKVRSQIR